MVVVIPREGDGEMAVWIEEPIGHAVVMWVEVAVRSIARGHDQVTLAVVVVVVVVLVVLQGQYLEEEEAKGVSNSVGVVEEVAKEAAEVETEAEAGVEAHRTGVVLVVEVVVEVPTSVEVVKVVILPATSARSTQTQSSRAHEAACHPRPSPGPISWTSTVPKALESLQSTVGAARRRKTDCVLNVDPNLVV